jgi:predicted dehydrogenase
MYNVICFGFGRMGITHLSLLNGYLGADQTSITIVDTKFVSRLLAQILYPRANIYKFTKRIIKEMSGRKFDFVILATPPNVREEIIQFFECSEAKILVEKPVRVPLKANMMSGYVLQHSPMNDRVTKNLEHHSVRRVRASIVTNVNFDAANSSWRSGKFGNVLHEFGGHVLSVVASCMPCEVFNDAIEKSCINIREHSRNKTFLEILTNGILVEVDLHANREDVRKASYDFSFYGENGDLVCNYDLYNLTVYRNGSVLLNENIARNGTNVDFYLRGFEFSWQIQNLLNSSGDRLSKKQIDAIELILDVVG